LGLTESQFLSNNFLLTFIAICVIFIINWILLVFRTALRNKRAAEVSVACQYIWIFITKSLKLRTWGYLPRKIVPGYVKVAYQVQ
jgi:hypothetical protein